jgi:hypothetical protein
MHEQVSQEHQPMQEGVMHGPYQPFENQRVAIEAESRVGESNSVLRRDQDMISRAKKDGHGVLEASHVARNALYQDTMHMVAAKDARDENRINEENARKLVEAAAQRKAETLVDYENQVKEIAAKQSEPTNTEHTAA